MTSRDFCFFEVHGETERNVELTDAQIDCIRKHLALVFKHEIDPSAGPPQHQAALDSIHSGMKF